MPAVTRVRCWQSAQLQGGCWAEVGTGGGSTICIFASELIPYDIHFILLSEHGAVLLHLHIHILTYKGEPRVMNTTTLFIHHILLW